MVKLVNSVLHIFYHNKKKTNMWGKSDGYWLRDKRDDDNEGFEHHEQKV